MSDIEAIPGSHLRALLRAAVLVPCFFDGGAGV